LISVPPSLLHRHLHLPSSSALRLHWRAWRAVVTALALVCSTLVVAQTLQPVPRLEARVTDLTGTLTAGQQADLEQKLAAFEQRKGSQVALLVVATTAPEAIEQYSIRVVEAWKLGRAKPDDGVLLLVALQDKALRIEVGYGLEGALPDAIARRVIDDTITPLFRQGDFYGGVNAGLQQIMSVVEGEALPPPDRSWRSRGDSLLGLLPLLFFGVFIGGSILRAIFGRTVGAIATGGITGALVWVVSSIVGIAVLAGIAALLFSLFAGIASTARGGRGGGFGGGGASGRW
jgi:uncharacterized protein